MFYRKFLFAIVSLVLVLINGCASSYAPSNWLPDTDQIQSEAFGGWLTISIADSTKNLWVGGEFISTDNENVYLLPDSMVRIVSKKDIKEAILELDDKNTWTFAGITVLGTLSTLSHGWYLIFSAPLWIIVGSSASGGESYRDRYAEEIPPEVYWEEIQKFARFPQGLPPNLNLSELQPKIISVAD